MFMLCVENASVPDASAEMVFYIEPHDKENARAARRRA
jgi:hypothetical protein